MLVLYKRWKKHNEIQLRVEVQLRVSEVQVQKHFFIHFFRQLCKEQLLYGIERANVFFLVFCVVRQILIGLV